MCIFYFNTWHNDICFIYFIKHICISSSNNHILVNTSVVDASYLNIYSTENYINITKPVFKYSRKCFNIY